MKKDILYFTKREGHSGMPLVRQLWREADSYYAKSFAALLAFLWLQIATVGIALRFMPLVFVGIVGFLPVGILFYFHQRNKLLEKWIDEE